MNIEIKAGKFCVIYGPNNIGKTTQFELLHRALNSLGVRYRRIKYPIYNLEPTGPLINSVLREGRRMSSLELQELFAQNRRDYEPELNRTLDSGVHVFAEDYDGTGKAWGITHGIPIEKMEEINAGLKREDLAILLDGERFGAAIEKGHLHEDSDKWETARAAHQFLAKRYSWTVVNANGPIEEVHDRIMKHVRIHILS